MEASARSSLNAVAPPQALPNFKASSYFLSFKYQAMNPATILSPLPTLFNNFPLAPAQ